MTDVDCKSEMMKFSLKILLSLGYLMKVEMSEEEAHPFDFIIRFT